MIIPIRCFQCGKVMADKWNIYQSRLDELKMDQPNTRFEDIVSLVKKQGKTPELQAMEELGITRYCCRSIFLGTVDLTDKI